MHAKISTVMKKNRMIMTSILTLSLLAGCQNTLPSTSVQTNQPVEDSYSNTSLSEVFNTIFSYKEYTSNKELASAHFKASEQLLQKYTQLFDIYNTYDGINNLKTINDNAGKQAVEVDQSIIDMLNMAKQLYTYSDGEFDVTIGSLLKVWHAYRKDGIAKNKEGELGKLPSKQELEEAAQYKGWDTIEIDDDANTVFITDENVSLDVGGIAKGYATELVAQAMMQSSLECGILNVGRNIRLIDTKQAREWKVGITDPDGDPEGKYAEGLLILSLHQEESIVTSGDYERYYKAEDGNIYPHIVDPKTMYPARYYRSVSIVTKDSGIADCLSTALFTMSIEEGKALLETVKENTGEDVDAIWITENDVSQEHNYKKVGNYSVVYTEGLEDKIIWN